MPHKAKILFSEFVTHDVKRFIVEKPQDYKFVPGQATEVAINLPEWKDKARPFTFTSQNEDLVLEFTIKEYPEHEGVTQKLHSLKSGEELLLEDPWGTIRYKEPGVFIAGGAGITPFIAILRMLRDQQQLNGNSLIFSNKTEKDIILQKEFENMFEKENLTFTLTREKGSGYEHGRIDKQFLEKRINDFDQAFYVCGPPKFVENITKDLGELGAKSDFVVIES